jgi:hypothetical protein
VTKVGPVELFTTALPSSNISDMVAVIREFVFLFQVGLSLPEVSDVPFQVHAAFVPSGEYSSESMFHLLFRHLFLYQYFQAYSGTSAYHPLLVT